jgi:putative transposase
VIKAIKIRLKPTNEQEVLMFKSIGCARFAYNWGLSKWDEIYKQGGKPSKAKIRAEFNNTIKNDSNYVWLKEVSAQVTQHAFEDLDNAYNNFFKVLSKYPKFKTKNIIKLEKQIKLIHRKLNNIRLNHIHQATNMIAKLHPYRVIMENLNISGMMKNKYLSESIQEQKFYEFIRQIKYKCEFNGIEFVTANRFYPSSKICSCCGSKKEDLRLKDRIYVCDKCGLEIDRDKNASINLGNYKIA